MRRHLLPLGIAGCGVVLVMTAAATPLPAQPVTAAPERARPAKSARVDAKHHAPDAELKDLRVVGLGEHHAVVRFGSGPLLLVAVGDRLGRTSAEVKEIEGGRLALEELYTAADGLPNVARIVLRAGEQGGTRYLQRPDQAPPAAVRPVPPSSRPASKKPPPPRPVRRP